MTNPHITFEVKTTAEGRPFLAAELHDAGVDKDDIRMRFARLGMRYAQQVADSGPLPVSGVSEGDKVSATLVFTQAEVFGDGDPFIDYDGDDDDTYYNYDDEEVVTDERAIGFRLQISHLGDTDARPFGWAVSPAVISAMTVSRMMRAAIEQAAGVTPSGSPREDEPEGPGF